MTVKVEMILHQILGGLKTDQELRFRLDTTQGILKLGTLAHC